ncbi:MAG TPA: nuclear transport factor 2 family protein [Anaerolineae bacterium]|nr:nuclear transport factor 2 family protein [Anaerolineae bacterium]HNU03268.1 nuclear transport factor 2 family protein [Anaerolineae bacterium]
MENKNVATLRAAHDAFSAHDCARSAAIGVGSNVRFVDHGRGITVSSREEFQSWLEGHIATSSDIRIVDAHYIDAGDWVTARFRAVGTQDGPIPPGFPASHKPFSLDICEVWHVGPDGKADEGHNYSDGLGYMMQLGHFPPLG